MSSTAATVVVDGAPSMARTFLVFRFCQTLLAVCPLVGFLATVATLVLELGGAVLVSRTFCFPFGLALALALIELAVFRFVAGTSAHEASFSFASHSHCWVPTPLLDHPCRRFGQTEKTLTCSSAPLGTSHLLGLLPT